jgi:cyclin L
MRSITNIYTYLLSPQSALKNIPNTNTSSSPPSDLDSLYVTESAYLTFRTRVLNIEGQICAALGFETHVAIPHPLAITYLQALDVFGSSQSKGMGNKVAKRAVEYLNTALLSPQMLYLTHQPTALATAAVYLAARDCGAKLPGCEWWEVFDTEREELGFLALGMKSLEGWVRREREIWGERGWLTRADVREELKRRGNAVTVGEEDEEAQMMRVMDEKMQES